MISRRGLIYTVEEVSDLLGIPRPTLYRYLREYSIPHLRRSGRISIPEDSFDRIREARDLHKEGLGTESVRRLLREGNGDSGELKERLERLSQTLERIREDSPAADEALPSQALRTVLARQSLIMSAMFNLTEMVEELLLASGKPRKAVFEEVEGEIREVAPPLERTEIPDEGPATTKPDPEILPRSAVTAVRRKRFGSLARRRRRSSLALLLSVLLAGVILMWALPTLGGWQAEESSSGARSGDSQERQGPAVAQNPSAGNDASENVAGSRSSGPGEAVPDVSGQGVVEASRTLSGAGFEVAAIKTVTSQEEAGTITRTVPSAGSAVGPGTPIVLIVSGGRSPGP